MARPDRAHQISDPIFLTKVIDTLKHYDIKNFLVDSRHNRIEVSEEEHEAVAYQFSRDLLSTRVRKMARISSQDMVREKRTDQVKNSINAEIKFDLAYQEFEDVASALAWLGLT